MLELPEHIVAGAADTVTVGVGFTVTVTVSGVPGQPDVVPVTVYVVVVPGLTEIVDVVAPVLHEYVPAPLAVSVVEPPEHIVAGAADVVTVGVVFTVIVTVAISLQPLVVPVTVYVVVEAGLAVTDAVFVALKPVEGLQVYVVAPPAVNTVPVPPVHIDEEVGVTVTVGGGFTVTGTDCVLVQPPEVPVTV